MNKSPEWLEHPTDEFFVFDSPDAANQPYAEPEAAPNLDLLPIKPLQADTLATLWDPETDIETCTKAVLAECKTNPDLKKLITDSDFQDSDFPARKLRSYKKVRDNPQLQSHLLEKGLDYAEIQKSLEGMVTPHFIKSVPKRIRRKKIYKGSPTDKYEATTAFHDVYQGMAEQVDEIFESVPGFKDDFDTQKPKNWDNLPIDKQRKIIDAKCEKFSAAQAKAEKKAAAEASALAQKEAAKAQALQEKEAAAAQTRQEKQARQQQQLDAQAIKARLRQERRAARAKTRTKEKIQDPQPEPETGQLQMDFSARKAAPATPRPKETPDARGQCLNVSRTAQANKVGITINIVAPSPSTLATEGLKKVKSITSSTVEKFDNMGTDTQRKVTVLAATAILTGVATGLSSSGEDFGTNGKTESDKALIEKHKRQANSPDAILRLETGKLVKPSVEAEQRLKIEANTPLKREKTREAVIADGEDYAKTRVANISAKASKIEPSLAENPESRQTVRHVDQLALYGLRLAINNRAVTPQQVDELSEWASDAMIAARHPQIANHAVVPNGIFQKDVAEFLKYAQFSKMPEEHYTDQQGKVVMALLSKLYDSIAPDSNEKDVMIALIAKSADINKVLQDNREKKKPSSKKNKPAVHHTISPNVGRGMSKKAQRVYQQIVIDASKKYNTDPNFVASFYYVENARVGDSTNNANSAAGVPVTGDGTWREPAAPYGKGAPYGTNQFETAGPHQFIPDTWKAYGVDADGDGVRNPNNLKDGVYGAARYVADVGGTKGASNAQKRKAAFDYNHSNTYVQSVMNTERYLDRTEAKANKAWARARARARAKQRSKARSARSESRSKGGERIAGATDLGIHKAYVRGHQISTRLYAIKGFKSWGDESTVGNRYHIKGSNRNVIVGARATRSVVRMFRAAKTDGLTLSAVSSIRVHPHQKDLARANSNRNEVATPGYSPHENPRKSAIDLRLGTPIVATYYKTRNGRPASPTNPRVAPQSRVWRWAHKNARKYGYHQFWNEPWHYERIKKR
ncbi:MAG: lytic murein transglycosylase [Candidatus Saccharimonadales bacterium]